VATTDLDSVQARLRQTADALLPLPAAPAQSPAVMVEVTAMPEPRRWLFSVQRDDQGRISAVIAEAM
jgi:hypothetical protein